MPTKNMSDGGQPDEPEPYVYRKVSCDLMIQKYIFTHRACLFSYSSSNAGDLKMIKTFKWF